MSIRNVPASCAEDAAGTAWRMTRPSRTNTTKNTSQKGMANGSWKISGVCRCKSVLRRLMPESSQSAKRLRLEEWSCVQTRKCATQQQTIILQGHADYVLGCSSARMIRSSCVASTTKLHRVRSWVRFPAPAGQHLWRGEPLGGAFIAHPLPFSFPGLGFAYLPRARAFLSIHLRSHTMTHSKLSIAMLVFLAPAVAFAHGGGGGMGGGAAGHGSIGVASSMGQPPNAGGGMDSSNRAGAASHIDRAAHGATNRAGGKDSNNDAHGDAVSAAAKAAKLDHDGDTVGSDVRAVAHNKTLDRTHVRTHVKTHASKIKGTDNDAHGDAVSAAAKAAKLDKDGDTVGSDVSTVAHTKTQTPHHK
jgi:hypothetical protein